MSTDAPDPRAAAPVSTAIVPWLTVRRSGEAVEFYKAAFGAVEVFRLGDAGDDVIARLSVHGAEFWVGGESPRHFNFSPESLNGSTVRIIFTVPDPDAVFARALQAGATQIFAVSEEHGWRVGRVADPYGHHWEIGRLVGGA
jgi:PhnB protein